MVCSSSGYSPPLRSILVPLSFMLLFLSCQCRHACVLSAYLASASAVSGGLQRQVSASVHCACRARLIDLVCGAEATMPTNARELPEEHEKLATVVEDGGPGRVSVRAKTGADARTPRRCGSSLGACEEHARTLDCGCQHEPSCGAARLGGSTCGLPLEHRAPHAHAMSRRCLLAIRDVGRASESARYPNQCRTSSPVCHQACIQRFPRAQVGGLVTTGSVASKKCNAPVAERHVSGT